MATVMAPVRDDQEVAAEKSPSVEPHVTSNLWLWTVGGAMVVLAALYLIAANRSPGLQGSITNATSALVLISAAAVCIERILEVFWTFIDNTAGTFWPLTAIDKTINDLVNSITAEAQGPLKTLDAAVNEAKNGAEAVAAEVAAVPGQIQSIRDGVAQLNQLAPTSDRAKAITAYTTRSLNAVAQRYPSVKADVGIAVESVSAISDFVDSLDENPGRRILSIYLGALIGLAVVLALGLDIFQATLNTSPQVTIGGITILGVTILANQTWNLGVATTGLVIGLGSNPTHELIKTLQNIKQSSGSGN
jgi:hypothetical protein